MRLNIISFGEYYQVAILPTGVKKPKNKPSVEGAVGDVATAIIAKLKNEEKPLLRALPTVPYEVCEWSYKHKVGNNSHAARDMGPAAFELVRKIFDESFKPEILDKACEKVIIKGGILWIIEYR